MSSRHGDRVLGGHNSKETSSGFSNFRALGEWCKVGTGQVINTSRFVQGLSAHPGLDSWARNKFASLLMA